jgi:hypothetical protein
MIPAYVHQPLGRGNGAAVLVVPGHGSGIRATAGLIDDYQHAAAREIAKQGYVTLTPELRGFGMLTPDGVATHRLVAAAALEAGSFYKAPVVRDLAFAMTVLQHWQGVDDGKLAVAGASLGGEVAVMFAVLDARVRVIIAQSYGGRSGPMMVDETGDDEAGQTPHGCHSIPGVNRLLLQEDWFRALAPRPVLVVRGNGNVSDRTEPFMRAVSQTYGVFGVPNQFQFSVQPGGHEFFVTPAVEFLSKWL